MLVTASYCAVSKKFPFLPGEFPDLTLEFLDSYLVYYNTFWLFIWRLSSSWSWVVESLQTETCH